jgi:Tfp pilus assembly protein PilN
VRPVNLIPKEERRGHLAPLRSGPLAYFVLGALVAALAGVILLVVTGNEISDSRAELANVEAQTSAAKAKAAKLAPFTAFHLLQQQRTETISNLADSRFDWERVMRQLALILPRDVWLTSLTGTATPEVQVNGGAGIAMRQSIPGPALEMVGCAAGQEGVAKFVAELKDIDGVTRVGLQSSELPIGESSGGSGSESASASGNCQVSKGIAEFRLVVAFDAAPIPTVGSGEGTEEVVEPAPESTESSEASSTESTEGSEAEATTTSAD